MSTDNTRPNLPTRSQARAVLRDAIDNDAECIHYAFESFDLPPAIVEAIDTVADRHHNVEIAQAMISPLEEEIRDLSYRLAVRQRRLAVVKAGLRIMETKREEALSLAAAAFPPDPRPLQGDTMESYLRLTNALINANLTAPLCPVCKRRDQILSVSPGVGWICHNTDCESTGDARDYVAAVLYNSLYADCTDEMKRRVEHRLATIPTTTETAQ